MIGIELKLLETDEFEHDTVPVPVDVPKVTVGWFASVIVCPFAVAWTVKVTVPCAVERTRKVTLPLASVVC